MRRYRKRFLSREQGCNLAGFGKARSLLHAALVDVGRNGVEIDAGIGKQRLARAALRRKNQRLFSAPEAHLRKPSHSDERWRCRSVNNFITAAAVSSIDRRVTSSCAQLNLAHNRRANATSSATT